MNTRATYADLNAGGELLLAACALDLLLISP